MTAEKILPDFHNSLFLTFHGIYLNSSNFPCIMNKQFLFSLIIAGLSLGTAWAIRGQFGHVQGAAWAGGIGALIIVLLAKRKDWYAKVFQLTLASAAGWGVPGMISYGIVVGYGRGNEFGNVFYGLLMLFVIGGLFGLIGGGIFGLALADNKNAPVKWHRLVVEMTAGAVIFYHLLIGELNWLMTPPRSEAWAGCVGMSFAMFWYMIRHKQYQALRIAVFAGLGAGFGFAFGNFLQVMGHVSALKFNFWNVMEYSIGFFGGSGMAYGTFTSIWPQTEETTNRNNLIAPVTILTLIIPFIVWDQSFETERMINIVKSFDPLANASAITANSQIIALAVILLAASYWFYYYFFREKNRTLTIRYQDVYQFFLGHFGLFAFYSLMVTGAFISLYRIEQYLYILNIIVIGFVVGKFKSPFYNRGLNPGKWTINLLFIMAVIALLAIVALSSHGEIKGAHNRF